MLTLEHMKDNTEQEVIEHLVTSYSGTESGFSYGEISEADIYVARKKLEGMKVLIAYESVGSWGCDSSSYFLLEKEGKLFEVFGSHCSCFGFEGQLELEETTKEALRQRAEKGNLFYAGGYDNNETENQSKARMFILEQLH